MRRTQGHGPRAATRTMLGLVVGGLTAAAVTVAVTPAGAGPTGAETVPAPAVVATTTPAPAAPASTTTASPSRSVTPAATPKRTRTAKPKTTTRRSTSCAERAMQAGRFDPSCSGYQGYLDPGTAAGREPTSGEIQMQYACEQGLVPRSKCE